MLCSCDACVALFASRGDAGVAATTLVLRMSSPSSVLDYQPDAPRDNYKWAVVAMLWFVCFFNYADRQAIFSVFPLLKSEMHLSDVQLGIVGGSFMWVYAAALPIAGMIGDRASRKVLILGGLIFW